MSKRSSRGKKSRSSPRSPSTPPSRRASAPATDEPVSHGPLIQPELLAAAIEAGMNAHGRTARVTVELPDKRELHLSVENESEVERSRTALSRLRTSEGLQVLAAVAAISASTSTVVANVARGAPLRPPRIEVVAGPPSTDQPVPLGPADLQPWADKVSVFTNQIRRSLDQKSDIELVELASGMARGWGGVVQPPERTSGATITFTGQWSPQGREEATELLLKPLTTLQSKLVSFVPLPPAKPRRSSS